jgi:hypothetical protein
MELYAHPVSMWITTDNNQPFSVTNEDFMPGEGNYSPQHCIQCREAYAMELISVDYIQLLGGLVHGDYVFYSFSGGPRSNVHQVTQYRA